MQQDFAAAAADENEVAECIRRTRQMTGYALEPHTACAVIAADKTRPPGATAPEIVLATAHPAKFAEAMSEIVGAPTPLPDRYADLLTAIERFEVVANDLAAIEQIIAARARAAHGDAT
jgi:threonine synthase